MTRPEPPQDDLGHPVPPTTEPPSDDLGHPVPLTTEPPSDDLGHPVPLTRPARRVVSLVPSLTESVAVTRAGALVGATTWCTHPADLDVTRVRGTKNPDLAAIRALEPDLVAARPRPPDPRRHPDLARPVDGGRLGHVHRRPGPPPRPGQRLRRPPRPLPPRRPARPASAPTRRDCPARRAVCLQRPGRPRDGSP